MKGRATQRIERGGMPAPRAAAPQETQAEKAAVHGGGVRAHLTNGLRTYRTDFICVEKRRLRRGQNKNVIF